MKSISIRFLFISFFLFLSFAYSVGTQAKVRKMNLPSFQQIKELPTEKRKAYLSGFAKLVEKKEYRFLYKYLVVKIPVTKTKTKKRKTKKMKRGCLPHVYGEGVTPKGKKRNLRCKQSLPTAVSHFDSDLNAPGWMTLRTALTIDCIDNRVCKSFLAKQNSLYKKLSLPRGKSKK